MPTDKEFQQAIKEALPIVQKRIPLNYRFEGFEVVDKDHEIFKDTKSSECNDKAPTALAYIDEDNKTFKLYFNRDSDWWNKKFKARIFGVLAHEFSHVDNATLESVFPKEQKLLIERVDEDSAVRIEYLAIWAWEQIYEQ